MVGPIAIAILSASLLPSSIIWAQTTPAPSSTKGFVNTLMPQPSQLSVQEGRLAITPSFTAGTDQFRDARLDDAIGRSLDRIKTQTATLISTALAADKATATLVVSVDGPGDGVQSVDEDESYSLDVTPFGARLRAAPRSRSHRRLE